MTARKETQADQKAASTQLPTSQAEGELLLLTQFIILLSDSGQFNRVLCRLPKLFCSPQRSIEQQRFLGQQYCLPGADSTVVAKSGFAVRPSSCDLCNSSSSGNTSFSQIHRQILVLQDMVIYMQNTSDLQTCFQILIIPENIG